MEELRIFAMSSMMLFPFIFALEMCTEDGMLETHMITFEGRCVFLAISVCKIPILGLLALFAPPLFCLIPLGVMLVITIIMAVIACRKHEELIKTHSSQ